MLKDLEGPDAWMNSNCNKYKKLYAQAPQNLGCLLAYGMASSFRILFANVSMSILVFASASAYSASLAFG
jgi:hypothetical protein